MNNKPKILIQFDCDQHPSVFDSVVAIDSGVDHLLQYGQVEPVDVRELVYGAMFTRSDQSRKNTAIFIGGSKVNSAEQVLRSVVDCFFGSVRVSVMLDANGANTTAAAAVLRLQRHLPLQGATVGILAATGSVGRRIARIMASQGATVRVSSRSLERATKLCNRIKSKDESYKVVPFETDGPNAFAELTDGCDAIISAGAASIRLLKREQWTALDSLKVAIDLNAVPPTGLEGIEPHDAAKEVDGITVYGAIGVGNLKMKIHKQSIRRLFQTNDLVLDLDEIFAIGQEIERDLAT